MSLSSAPLSRPLVDGACPRVVGTQRGRPAALGTLPSGGRALPRGRAKCRGRGAREVRQLLRPHCKVLQGAAGFPAHGALGQERAGVHPGLQGRWSLLSLKAWTGAAAPRFRPQTLTISIPTPVKMQAQGSGRLRSLPWDRWTLPDGAELSCLPGWDVRHTLEWGGGGGGGGACSLLRGSRNQIIGRPPTHMVD